MAKLARGAFAELQGQLEVEAAGYAQRHGLAARGYRELLGTRFSALDVYAKVMTHWRPRRDWFKDNCPKLMSVALAADKEPRLAKVWQRNFPAA